jgi:hypothetical protein
MSLKPFIEAAERRDEAYAEASDGNEEEDENDPNAPDEPFSIAALVAQSGGDYIQRALHLTWEEFQDLFRIVKHPLSQTGRGRRRSLERIDRSIDSLS